MPTTTPINLTSTSTTATPVYKLNKIQFNVNKNLREISIKNLLNSKIS